LSVVSMTPAPDRVSSATGSVVPTTAQRTPATPGVGTADVEVVVVAGAAPVAAAVVEDDGGCPAWSTGPWTHETPSS
jgi:hypothetical protein